MRNLVNVPGYLAYVWGAMRLALRLPPCRNLLRVRVARAFKRFWAFCPFQFWRAFQRRWIPLRALALFYGGDQLATWECLAIILYVLLAH